MMTLKGILEEAGSHPCAGNVALLSLDQFHSIRAPSSGVFRARLDAALAGPGDLAKAEEQNAIEGLEVVNPVRGGIHGGFWYLQNVSGRGERFPAGEVQYVSLVDALRAAVEWWEAESWCRGVMIRTFYCSKEAGYGGKEAGASATSDDSAAET